MEIAVVTKGFNLLNSINPTNYTNYTNSLIPPQPLHPRYFIFPRPGRPLSSVMRPAFS